MYCYMAKDNWISGKTVVKVVSLGSSQDDQAYITRFDVVNIQIMDHVTWVVLSFACFRVVYNHATRCEDLSSEERGENMKWLVIGYST